MFCPNCGAQNADNVAFCASCGANMTAQQAPVQQPVYQQPVYQQQPASVPGKGLGIAGMVLGIVSLVLFCATYISIPCAIVGIILSGVGLKKAKDVGMKNGMAVAGLLCHRSGCVRCRMDPGRFCSGRAWLCAGVSDVMYIKKQLPRQLLFYMVLL